MMLGVKHAYCLCLDKRKEHWEDLKEQCESKGIKFHPFIVGDGDIFDKDQYNRINTETPEWVAWRYGGHKTDSAERVAEKINHHYNAFRSHQKMAKLALQQGHEKVLFLEDDAYFTERFDEIADKIQDKVEESDYDMLYLGWWIGDEGDEFNETIERIWQEEKSIAIGKAMRIGGLHGVIINKKILDLITRLDPINPIDSQLSRFFHDKIKSHFVAPKIIHDKGIFSECEQSTVTRTKL
tara:strand:- start:2147 stop:2863 length:717 start_codon:yes stop_codon:yes gene_type:complete